MKKAKVLLLCVAGLLLMAGAWAKASAPLRLIKSVPLPKLHDGDFDHFTADLQSNRLFAAAEENSKVLVFQLDSGKLLDTLTGLKAPHSMLYRDDLKRLFVVDGGLGAIRMFDGSTLKPIGDIKLRLGADSSLYDPATQELYVISGGSDFKLPSCYLTAVNTTTDQKVREVKLDSDDVEAMALEKNGPRLFVLIRGNSTVEVFNRKTLSLLHTWPLKVAKAPTAVAFDEAHHRLLIATRKPGELVVMDSDTGQILNSQPAAPTVDDLAFGHAHRRLYYAGSGFLDVFQQQSPDRYALIGRIPTRLRAKTGILVPELGRYYLGVPHLDGKLAELRIYQIVP